MQTLTNSQTQPLPFNTLEEIQQRKQQLGEAIEHDSEQIAGIFNNLFKKQENTSKGDMIASVITKSITAIDAFLMVRKLAKNYSGLFPFLNKGKKMSRK